MAHGFAARFDGTCAPGHQCSAHPAQEGAKVGAGLYCQVRQGRVSQDDGARDLAASAARTPSAEPSPSFAPSAFSLDGSLE